MADGIFKRLHEALGKPDAPTTFNVPLKDPADIMRLQVLFENVLDRYCSQNNIREKIRVELSDANPEVGKVVTPPASAGGFTLKTTIRNSPPSLTLTSDKPLPKGELQGIIEEINDSLFRANFIDHLPEIPAGYCWRECNTHAEAALILSSLLALRAAYGLKDKDNQVAITDDPTGILVSKRDFALLRDREKISGDLGLN